MKPYWQCDDVALYQGHVLDVLKALPAESCQCVATSPPYWKQRDYGLPPVEWPGVRYAPMPGLPAVEVAGCDPECDHRWADTSYRPQGHADDGATNSGLEGGKSTQAQTQRDIVTQATCSRCGGWRGSLGLERTPTEYVGHLVLIWRELRRVMRDDATCWLNLGDSYANDTKWGGQSGGKNYTSAAGGYQRRRRNTGLGSKNLVGMPWRVAFALQADGWWWRQTLPWVKRNSMPESADDRPNTSIEQVHLFSKGATYYFDMEAARECYGFARNWRNGDNLLFLDVLTQGFGGPHFATFNADLITPMIYAGTSQRGACPKCAAPWRRVVERTGGTIGKSWHDHSADLEQGMNQTRHFSGGMGNAKDADGQRYQRTTIGWQPTCSHAVYKIRDDLSNEERAMIQSAMANVQTVDNSEF